MTTTQQLRAGPGLPLRTVLLTAINISFQEIRFSLRHHQLALDSTRVFTTILIGTFLQFRSTLYSA